MEISWLVTRTAKSCSTFLPPGRPRPSRPGLGTIEPLPGTQPLRLSPPSDKEAHFDSSTASAIEASAVCKGHEFWVVVLATLAVPLTFLRSKPESKVLAVNSVSLLADALRTLLLAAICSALASSTCVAFAVSGSVAVDFIDPGCDPPVLVCC